MVGEREMVGESGRRKGKGYTQEIEGDREREGRCHESHIES